MLHPTEMDAQAASGPAQALTDDLELLLTTLPEDLQARLWALPLHSLLEIVMDLGRPPQARLSGEEMELRAEPVNEADLEHVASRVGEFCAENRAGIEGTLHRISALRNRRGKIVGLTLRVGRAVFGTIDLIRDLVEAGKNILLLGRPGVGKTTKLREIARVLADDFGKRVIVIDTSNEIGGDGDISHPAIGGARRMQVPHPERQHAVMIEAVENHMPEVIIIDEISTAAEVMAARTIAERGVQLIGTAHGNTLENLVLNPTLSDLVGGTETVTLGDEEARFRGTRKTITERKAPPTFDAVVQIIDWDEVVVYFDSARAVDRLLRGVDPCGVHRHRNGTSVTSVSAAPVKLPSRSSSDSRHEILRIYPYAISRDSVERVIRDLRVEARTVKQPEQADLVIALRSRKDDARLRRLLSSTGTAVQVVKSNTTAQIRRTLQDFFNVLEGVEDAELQDAVHEVEAAIERVKGEGVSAEIAPRRSALRRLQHRVVTRHGLLAQSVGSEPRRHLVVYPD